MKFYIPFGDWSMNGHGRVFNLLVEAPSMEGCVQAQNKIRETYGKDIFQNMAGEYVCNYLEPDVIHALQEEGYSKPLNENQEVLIGDVIEIFLFLLNKFGAEITNIDDYPVLSPLVFSEFEPVGYGCLE